jgi:hypothetical protein
MPRSCRTSTTMLSACAMLQCRRLDCSTHFCTTVDDDDEEEQQQGEEEAEQEAEEGAAAIARSDSNMAAASQWEGLLRGRWEQLQAEDDEAAVHRQRRDSDRERDDLLADEDMGDGDDGEMNNSGSDYEEQLGGREMQHRDHMHHQLSTRASGSVDGDLMHARGGRSRTRGGRGGGRGLPPRGSGPSPVPHYGQQQHFRDQPQANIGPGPSNRHVQQRKRRCAGLLAAPAAASWMDGWLYAV